MPMGRFFYIVLATRKNELFWGGDNFKTGEPVSILGHIDILQACPTRFFAQKKMTSVFCNFYCFVHTEKRTFWPGAG